MSTNLKKRYIVNPETFDFFTPGMELEKLPTGYEYFSREVFKRIFARYETVEDALRNGNETDFMVLLFERFITISDIASERWEDAFWERSNGFPEVPPRHCKAISLMGDTEELPI